MSLQTFEFEGQQNEIDLNNKTVMVNATEMASVFNKKVNEFMSNETTKNFISECLKSGNSRFISVEKEEDLYVSRQKSGTWMHRILALKFAAWLNPAFELWVYATIDELLFGSYKSKLICPFLPNHVFPTLSYDQHQSLQCRWRSNGTGSVTRYKYRPRISTA